MPQTAVLDAVRPVHHTPRRPRTATSVLRALGTGPLPVVAAEGSTDATPTTRPTSASPSAGDRDVAPAVRTLRVRDIAAGGGAAAASWSLAAHLGLLGTATGTFIVSVVSAVLMALAVDSVVGVRRLLLRWLRSARAARRHRSRAGRGAVARR